MAETLTLTSGHPFSLTLGISDNSAEGIKDQRDFTDLTRKKKNEKEKKANGFKQFIWKA